MRSLQTISSTAIPRHVHAKAYVSVVLSGGYEEAGDSGRFKVVAGDVLFHDEFQAHLNRVERSGAQVLNLPLGTRGASVSGLARVTDADLIVRVAERSRAEALYLLLNGVRRAEAPVLDWQDEFVAALRRNPSLNITEWAADAGLRPWKMSRGFKQVFGVTPEAFRARWRARLAWNLLRSDEVLSQIAPRCGFCDQAHMAHGVKAMTGFTPTQGRRRANRYKTTVR